MADVKKPTERPRSGSIAEEREQMMRDRKAEYLEACRPPAEPTRSRSSSPDDDEKQRRQLIASLQPKKQLQTMNARSQPHKSGHENTSLPDPLRRRRSRLAHQGKSGPHPRIGRNLSSLAVRLITNTR